MTVKQTLIDYAIYCYPTGFNTVDFYQKMRCIAMMGLIKYTNKSVTQVDICTVLWTFHVPE